MQFFNPTAKMEYVLRRDQKSAKDKQTAFVFRRLTREEMFEFVSRSPVTLEQAVKFAQVVAGLRADRKRQPTKKEQEVLEAIQPKNHEDLKRTQAAYAWALGVGLVEIRNLIGENGKRMEIKPEQFIAFAPAVVITELGEALLSFATPSEDDQKN